MGVGMCGYGPEVDSLMRELDSRQQPAIVIEEDETVARRLHARGDHVVHAALADEEICVIDTTAGDDIDVVADIMDHADLDKTPIAGARAVILTFESDTVTILATTVVRDYAPDVPIIASVDLVENAGRMQQAGADFALSVSQVAGQILAHHILGETVSHQPRIRLRKLSAGELGGRSPVEAKIRERTGCTIVAAERNGDVNLDIPPTFLIDADDSLYVCGTAAAFAKFRELFPATRA